MLLLDELADVTAGIFADLVTCSRSSKPLLKERRNPNLYAGGFNHMQAAISKCDNKPRLSAVDVKVWQEQKGFERRAAKLDDNTLRITHQASIYGHHRVPIDDKGSHRCLKSCATANSYKSSKWDGIACGYNNVLSEAYRTPPKGVRLRLPGGNTTADSPRTTAA